ncbi:MAG TPA: hypothetical protein VII68_11150 [Casimicrobiaceae bacterium]
MIRSRASKSSTTTAPAPRTSLPLAAVRTNCATRTIGGCALRPSREDHHRSVCGDHPRPALNASAVFPLARHSATRFFQIAELPDIKRAIFGQPIASVQNGVRAAVTVMFPDDLTFEPTKRGRSG